MPIFVFMRTPNHLKAGRKPATQSERVVAKFGGPLELAGILKCSAARIYKWNYPRSKGGCNGLIPTKAMDAIITLARLHGVLLTDDDLKPRTL